MTVPEIQAWTTLIVQVGTLIGVVASTLASLRNHSAIKDTQAGQKDIKEQMNGRMDELVAANKTIDTAAGVVIGKAEAATEQLRKGRT